MNKYKVFRSLGRIDRDVKKHMLVAVEYGEDIHTVSGVLIQAANDDAIGIDKYQKGFTSLAYAPEPVDKYPRGSRYAYYIMAVLTPECGNADILEYGIVEGLGEG